MIPAPTMLLTRLDDAPNIPDSCLGCDSFAALVFVFVFVVEVGVFDDDVEDDLLEVVSWLPLVGDDT